MIHNKKNAASCWLNVQVVCQKKNKNKNVDMFLDHFTKNVIATPGAPPQIPIGPPCVSAPSAWLCQSVSGRPQREQHGGRTLDSSHSDLYQKIIKIRWVCCIITISGTPRTNWSQHRSILWRLQSTYCLLKFCFSRVSLPTGFPSLIRSDLLMTRPPLWRKLL